MVCPPNSTMPVILSIVVFMDSLRAIKYNCSKKKLDHRAEQSAEALNKGKRAYVYFNNTSGGHATINAELFRDMVERKRG